MTALSPEALFQLLNQIEVGGDSASQYILNRNDDAFGQSMTTLAGHIRDAFLNKKWQMSDVEYYGLALHKHKLTAIFQLSADGNADALLKKLIAQYNRLKKPKAILKKILLLIGFDHHFEFDPWYFLAIDKHLGMEACLGMLARRVVLRAHEQQNYQRFIKQLDQISQWPVHDHTPVVLGQAWYQAAYDDAEYKYKTLAILNGIAKRWLAQRTVNTAITAPIQQNKPRLLVILEQFHSGHAMYRCFVNGIVALKDRYYLIAVGDAGSVDEPARALFDEYLDIQIKVPNDVPKVIAQLQSLKADATYFTSVGMKYWSILLANTRLSKVQCLTAGHPISACTDCIDFMLLEDHKFLPEIHFQEQVVGLPSGTFGFVLPSHTLPQRQREAESRIHIALPSSFYKLNASFLSLCQEIEKASMKPIVWHSFVGLEGLAFHQLSAALRQCLRQVVVYPKQSYDDYLAGLVECDLALAPFPFGGTNSTIDCLLLQLPMVALAYPDLACSDSFILNQVGLSDCIAASPAAYCKKALALIEDDQARASIRKQIASLDDTMNGLLGSPSSGLAYEHAMTHILNTHSAQSQADRAFIPSSEYVTPPPPP